MTRTEKLVTAAVLVVNLSIGAVLIERSDGVRADPLARDTVAALSPRPDAKGVTVTEVVSVARR